MLLIISLGLTGCIKKENKPIETNLPKPVICFDKCIILEKISKTADFIQKENIILARIKNASLRKPVIIENEAKISVGQIAKKITIRYSGPITSATEKIAKLIDYSHIVVGNIPANPIMIDVDFTDATAYQVLESIGWQSGQQTKLIINETDETLKIIFFEKGQG